jgi:hypothetical protein
MFRLSESDYKRLEPIALRVYRGSARSAHVAQLMESRVGRRALVDMMFLEAYASSLDMDGSSWLDDEEQIAKENQQAYMNGKPGSQPSDQNLRDILNAAEGSANYESEIKKQHMPDVPSSQPANASTIRKIFDKVKGFFSKIVKWLGDKTKPLLTKIYSYFFKEAKFKSPRWLRIAIAVAAVLVIGYIIFGSSVGTKIKNFIVKAAKASIGTLKSAFRYVLGKGGAPKQVIDETEDFLDEATA